MELCKILSDLYSQNDNLILPIINTAFHASAECYPRLWKCIHTGYFCRTHKDVLLGFIYCIDDKQLYFQHNNTLPLGTYMLPNKSAVLWGNWIDITTSNNNLFHCYEYNIANDNICVEPIKSVVQNKEMIFINGRNVFSIINGINKYSFKIYTPPIRRFYCGGEFKFRVLF